MSKFEYTRVLIGTNDGLEIRDGLDVEVGELLGADQAFDAEMAAVVEGTAIERQWMADAGARPFVSDAAIIEAHHEGRMQRITQGIGYRVIDRLLLWDTRRSDSGHQYHYSPPYLRPGAAAALEKIGAQWAETLDWPHMLSVTSLARSIPYQVGLAERQGKLAINPNIGLSTHVYGHAFDIDASGLMVVQENRELVKANPRMDARHEEVAKVGRAALEEILQKMADSGEINYVEEFSGTTNNCFHVGVKPVKKPTKKSAV